MEKKSVVLRVEGKVKEEMPNSFQFEWSAFTETEQAIFEFLLEKEQARNALEIYQGVGKHYLFKKIVSIKNNKALKDEMVDFWADDLGHLTRREVESKFAEYRKKGTRIPVYTTIVRMLEELVVVGWVNKREDAGGKAIAFYYLTKNIRLRIPDKIAP